MNWEKLAAACEQSVVLDRIVSQANRHWEVAREEERAHERAAFRSLQALLTRRVRQLVARHDGCLPQAVHVSAMINHANHTAKPWARVTWANPGARFEFTGTMSSDVELRMFLERVENSIAGNGP